MLQLEQAGGDKTGQAFDVFTKAGGFAGLVTEKYGKGCRVYFNSTATKGSKRVFRDINEAVAFIYNRRVQKGYHV